MRKRYISIISLLIIALLSLIITASYLTLFEGTKLNVSLNFYDPSPDFERSTSIQIPPFQCAYDSSMNIAGSWVNGTNDSIYEVVLITDLSGSMEDCIHVPYYNLSVTKDECYAFGDRFGEGASEQKWTIYRGTWNRVIEPSRGSVVFKETYANDYEWTPLAEINYLTFKNFHASFDASLYIISTSSARWLQFNFGRPISSAANYKLVKGTYSVRIKQNRSIELYKGGKGVAQMRLKGDAWDWHNYDIWANKSTIIVTVDGNHSMNWTDPDDTMPDGYISYSLNNAYLKLDNVYIKSLDHPYNCTKDYGYSSYVPGNAYLAKNISYTPSKEGVCEDWFYNSTATSCDGLSQCTMACSHWSYGSGCGGNPLCSTHDYAVSGHTVYCNSGTPCCANPSTCFPGDYTYWRDSYGRGYHSHCTDADMTNQYLYSCRTVSWDGSTSSYCPGGYTDRTYGDCSFAGTLDDASCVDYWCNSPTMPSSKPGTTCYTSNIHILSSWSYPSSYCDRGVPDPTSPTDSSTKRVCSYGQCDDPQHMCNMVNIPQGAGSCSSEIDNTGYYCHRFGSEGDPYYGFDRRYYVYERRYSYCPAEYYYWRGTRIRGVNRNYRYCKPENVVYRHCINETGEFTTKSDFFSNQFNDSSWADLYDYIFEFDDYNRYYDGSPNWDNHGYENGWQCDQCSRFYRKEFELRKNVAYKTPVTTSLGSCSNRDRITDGYVRDYHYSDCSTGIDTVQIDLREIYNLTGINVIMFFDDDNGRREYDVSVQVSEDNDFSAGYLILWNSSSDGPLPATPEGKYLQIPGGYKTRYIRLSSHGNNIDSYNRIAEVEAFTELPVEEVGEAWLKLNHEDGVQCYINGQYLYFNDTHYLGSYYGDDQVRIPNEKLRNGTNLLACQVKNAYYEEGFNTELVVDKNSTLFHLGSDMKFTQQETLCGSQYYHYLRTNRYGGLNNEFRAGNNSCEYLDEVESCQGYFPRSVTSPQNLVVSGWTLRSSIRSFYDGFVPVVKGFQSLIDADIGILNKSRVYNSFNEVDDSLWDADIIFFDGNTKGVGDSRIKRAIGNALIKSKIVITDRDRVQRYRSDGSFTFTAVRDAWSYDLYSQAWQVTYNNGTDSGTGILVADQVDNLAYYWESDYIVREPKTDKSANLLDAIMPVWEFTRTVTGPVPQNSACFQFGEYHGPEICNGIKIRLANINDEMFLNLTVGMNQSGVKVGLLAFGDDAKNCRTNTTLSDNETMLKNELKTYSSDCGETCISCSLYGSLNMLEPYMNNTLEDDIVLMTDGLSNRVIGSTAEVPSDQAIKEAIHWACNLSNPGSAASLNVTVHTIYYGAAEDQESIDAMNLLRNISNCTGGIFMSGADPEELMWAYQIIVGNLGTGYPSPKLRFGTNSSIPWDWEFNEAHPLLSRLQWWNRSCGTDSSCINLMTAVNREILQCAHNNYSEYNTTGCDIRLNATTNRSGGIILDGLNISLTNASVSPIAYPYAVADDYEIYMCPMDLKQCGNGFLDDRSGEECEDTADCQTGEFCIPPGMTSQCTCTNSTLTGVCGNGVVDSGESCDSNDSFADFSCYPPGAVVNGINVECKWISGGESCGDGAVDPSEECDPSAPPNHCGGGFKCYPPGSERSCTCVKKSWNIIHAGGGELNLTTITGGSLPDIDLLNHGVSPLYPRSALQWKVGISPDQSVMNFSITGKILQFNIGRNPGNISVNVTVSDFQGRNHSFRINAFIINWTPPEAIDINASLIMTSNRIINEFYEEKDTGFMKEFGPYTITMKVYTKDE